MTLLAKTQKGPFNSIGAELATIITAKNKITPYQKNNLNRARKNSPRKGRKSGRIIAQAMYEIYVRQDALATIKFINKNKNFIKMDLERLKNSSDYADHYIAESITEGLHSTIFEVWINEYGTGAKEVSSQSYDLCDFFGLLKGHL